MKTLLRHLGHQWAGVLALVLVLTGGTAYAAQHHPKLPKNSVAAKQVKDGSLTGTDLKDGSVTGSDVADGSLTGTDIADGGITGRDLAPGVVPGVLAASPVLAFSPAFVDALTVPGLGVVSLQCSGGSSRQAKVTVPAGTPVRVLSLSRDSFVGGGTTQSQSASSGTTAVTFPVGGTSQQSLDGQLYLTTPKLQVHISVYVGVNTPDGCPAHVEALVVPA